MKAFSGKCPFPATRQVETGMAGGGIGRCKSLNRQALDALYQCLDVHRLGDIILGLQGHAARV